MIKLMQEKGVQQFMEKWLLGSWQDACAALPRHNDYISQREVTRLVRTLVFPGGDDSVRGCIPHALLEELGTPPVNWPVIGTIAQQMFEICEDAQLADR